jgi:hypothetical protein
MSILLEKRSCLFVPDPDPDLGLEPPWNDATILFEYAKFRPKCNRDTLRESYQAVSHTEETNPNFTPCPAPPQMSGLC